MTESNKGIHILSIDAKDIYLSNHYAGNGEDTPIGYSVRLNDGSGTGDINIKKFTGSLDQSLDLIQLRRTYEKVYRNRNFSFSRNGREYTTRIINVTFLYSHREYNKVKKDTYVKSGFRLQDLKLTDHVCVRNQELLAIEADQNVDRPIPDSLLPKCFSFEQGQYRTQSSSRVLHTSRQLRMLLYQEGFYCDGIRYVRYKRSGGSARAGNCLFIDERLYRPMMKWSLCGLSFRQGQKTDLAGLEAYLALPLSSIIDTIQLRPENFLIIDDYKSVFQEDVVETRLEDGALHTGERSVTIQNSIWDGQSLLDTSLFQKFPGKGMLLLRNKFFKSACFHCDIGKWFHDRKITRISQLSGLTTASNIEDIKIITTPSSIKYLKFGSASDWFRHIEPDFGVVKYEKAPHFFDGRMVQTHYQLLNTLQLSEDDIRSFLQPSLDYLSLLKTDPAVLRYHIKYPENARMDTSPVLSKNDIVYRLLGLNEKFSETKLYNDFKNDLTKAYVKNLRCGHVLVNGNYSTLLGNPVEMLMQSIGAFDGQTRIGKGCIHSTRFAYGKQLLGSRSPHVTIGNIWLPFNTENPEIDRYFNLSSQIVCVNTIGESVPDRLSGCDFDSDTVLLTDNPILIQAALKNISLCKVPVNHVSSVQRRRWVTNEEKAELDIRTSDNKIGDIINLSQELNSLLWDKKNRGCSWQDIRELYYDICQLDVMSGIEIDKAKKEYTTDTCHEMLKIKEKWMRADDSGRQIKPCFFGHLAKVKGYYDNERKNYLLHETAMDYLQKIISQYQSSKTGRPRKKEFRTFSSILNKDNYQIRSVYYEQVERVLLQIEHCSAGIRKIYSDEGLDSSARFDAACKLKQECFEAIGKWKFSRNTMIYLLTLLDDPGCRIARNLLNILFSYPNTSFYEVIESSRGHIPIFIEQEDGPVKVFDFRFRKVSVE